MTTRTQTLPYIDETHVRATTQRQILVVDDDPYLVRLLKEDLELEGYGVACAYDGMHGLHMARERRYDLIILDINMPITNGYKVLEYLRINPKTATTPVIVVTAERSSDVYPLIARDPRASYIKKPLDIESLNSVIRHYLKH